MVEGPSKHYVPASHLAAGRQPEWSKVSAIPHPPPVFGPASGLEASWTAPASGM